MAGKGDKLVVQVSFKFKVPKQAQVKLKKADMQKLIDMLVAGKKLPKSVELRGIFWRNPNRAGALADWRYHSGADLSIAPSPIESRPRGSLRDAIASLADILSSGNVTF